MRRVEVYMGGKETAVAINEMSGAVRIENMRMDCSTSCPMTPPGPSLIHRPNSMTRHWLLWPERGRSLAFLSAFKTARTYQFRKLYLGLFDCSFVF